MPSSSRFRIHLAVLLLAALGLYLVGISSVGLWDRDEPRYAQCSRQMLRSGDWVVPRYPWGEWRLEKPPAIYWFQGAAMKVFGDMSSFGLRLPSSLGIAGSAAVLGLVVRRFVGARRALWSVFIFGTSGLAIAASKMCITDAVLLFFVITGQACLGMMYYADKRGKNAPIWIALLFWISMGIAGLVKGPQALGMHVMTMLILLLLDVGENYRSGSSWVSAIRWWRQLRVIIGVPLLVVVVSPWMVLVHQRAPGFLYELLHKAAMHSTQSMDGHGEPPGYHTILIFGTFFPWSLLLPTTITLAWVNRRLPQVRFATAAAFGPWILMECVWTKLPFYVLPAFPGLAFLTADALVRCMRGQFDDLIRPIFLWTVGVWAVVTLGLSGAPWLSLLVTRADQLPIVPMIAFSFFGVIYAAIVVLRFSQHRLGRAAIVMGGGMALMIVILFAGILPRLEFLRMSENLATDLQQLHAVGQDVPVAMIGYKEPSLTFYQGSGTVEEDDNYFAVTPLRDWPKWFVIDKDQIDQIPVEYRGILQARASVSGVMYAAPKSKKATAVILEKITANP